MKLRTSFTLLCLVFLSISCGKKGETDPRPGTAVVGIMADVDNFNPVVSTNTLSQQINAALFPLLFDEVFDMGEGRLLFKPMLARAWEHQNDGRDVVVHLRGDVQWQDGVPLTADDIKFTFGLYGNPDVASPRRNHVDNMFFTDGKFDLDKSITVVDDTTLVFHFMREYAEQLFHINLAPLPRHIYRNVDPKALVMHSANSQPVSAGPFKLVRWSRDQEIVLSPNPRCNLPYPARLNRLVLRVMRDAKARLSALQDGEVDFLYSIDPENVRELETNYPNIQLVTRPPRAYDFVGWANIDFEKYHASEGKTIVPHPLFGSKKVRQALTYAINRQAIIDGFLGDYGELAVTDILPAMKWAVNPNLKPYPYDPMKARELLKQEGWEDRDGDNFLDRAGRKFAFTLYYNAGNNRRSYAATIIQDNLRQVGIDAELEAVESNVFNSNLSSKKYDAFVVGFSVDLMIDPSSRWGSDLRNPFNTSGFVNSRVDKLIQLSHNVRSERNEIPFLQELQAILHEEQPVTFLYWYKDIVAINRRLHNAEPSIFGAIDRVWDWTIGPK